MVVNVVLAFPPDHSAGLAVIFPVSSPSSAPGTVVVVAYWIGKGFEVSCSHAVLRSEPLRLHARFRRLSLSSVLFLRLFCPLVLLVDSY